jgi:hypothetical protein
VKLHVNAPLGSVVMLKPVNWQFEPPVGVSTVASKVTFARELAVNPEPAAEKGLPTGPCPGVTVMAGLISGER